VLSDDDLTLAVTQGIVTEPQAAALRELAQQRSKVRAIALGHEERFRFMRGFNDFFFAVGIVLFAAGMAFYAVPTPAGCLIAAVITWALAELLVARMRLVLPGMFLVCIFAAFLVLASPIDLWFSSPSWDLDALRSWLVATRTPPKWVNAGSAGDILAVYAFASAAAAMLFYLRFRLPFALLVVAAALVGAALAVAHHVWPMAGPDIVSFVLLGCGLVVFLAAMGFDISDSERTTRRADCAFWLHLLAAPLIVHSLITLLTPNPYQLTTPVALAIAGIFVVLTVVAVAIDRRALLVSALIYIGVVMAFGIRSLVGVRTDTEAFVFFTTLLVLGAVVLILGVGWMPLRRGLMRRLPGPLARILPPAPAAA
jgi:hypothetical protein